jgi:hypothetical protein
MDLGDIWVQSKIILGQLWGWLWGLITDNPLYLLIVLAVILLLWWLIRPEVRSK